MRMANDTEYGLAAYFYTKVATTSSESATSPQTNFGTEMALCMWEGIGHTRVMPFFPRMAMANTVSTKEVLACKTALGMRWSLALEIGGGLDYP